MAAELIIAPEAQQDVDEAYCWYEDRRPGLGEEFLGCVDACIQAICRMPDLHAKVHEGYLLDGVWINFMIIYLYGLFPYVLTRSSMSFIYLILTKLSD